MRKVDYKEAGYRQALASKKAFFQNFLAIEVKLVLKSSLLVFVSILRVEREQREDRASPRNP